MAPILAASSAECVTTTSVTWSSAIQFHQQVTQRLGGGVVERAGRLVGKDEAGPIDQRAHDGDTLAFPAGKLVGAMGESMAKTDALEELPGAF